MKNSIDILIGIDDLLSNDRVFYEFNKVDNHLSKKYRKGRINVAKWLSELIFMFIQKERKFLIEFKELIQEQKKDLINLENGDFKKGLFDELNAIEEMINDRITRNK